MRHLTKEIFCGNLQILPKKKLNVMSRIHIYKTQIYYIYLKVKSTKF